MVAFTRFALLVGLLAGTTRADRGGRAAPGKYRRQYTNSSIPLASESPTRSSTSGINMLPSTSQSTTSTLGSSTSPLAPSTSGSGFTSTSSASTIPLPPYVSSRFPYSSLGPTTTSGSSKGGSALSSTRFSYNPSGSSVSTVTASNDTCSGATLNVLSASLDWWYGTYTYIASTYIQEFNAEGSVVGWTVVANPTPFDVTSALNAPSCAATATSDTAAVSASSAATACSSTPTPLAAATTTVDQIAYSTITATSGTGSAPNVVVTPPPAAITIPNSGGNFSAGTEFVFFSRYEIVRKTASTFGNGSVGCAEATSTYNMANPFSFEYTGGDVNGSVEVGAGVTGDVAPAFLGVVNVTNVIAGSWVALPTVAVVVSKVVAVSQSTLDTPTPTLPAGVSSATQPGNGGSGGGAASPASTTAVTQLSLELPSSSTGASAGGNGGSGSDSGTSSNGGGSGGNSGASSNAGGAGGAGGNSAAPQTSNNGGAGSGGSGSTASPTNALQVLTQAEATFPTNAVGVLTQAEATFSTNPTASAIVSGIGGDPGNAAAPPSITLDGSILSANAATQFDIDGSTLTPGGAIVVSGSTISLAPSATAMVVNGQTTPIVAATNDPPAPVITIGGSTLTANSATQYSIDGSTLTPGGTVVVAGSTYSLAQSATAIIVNGQTTPLAAATNDPPAPVLTVGGSTITANSATQYTIDGSVLTPGGTIVVAGSTISLAQSATAIIINGQTTPLTAPAITAAPSVITIDGQIVSATGSGSNTYIVSGQTLTPGGAITLTGPSGPETISLNSAGNEIYTVHNGITSSSSIALAAATSPPVLTIGSQTFTAISSGATYMIGGKTLTPGGAVTVTLNGQVYILSMSPGSATTLEIELANSAGVVTATSYEILMGPATRSAGVVTSTALFGSTGVSKTASRSGSVTAQKGAAAARAAPPSFTSNLQGVALALALGSLIVAVYL